MLKIDLSKKNFKFFLIDNQEEGGKRKKKDKKLAERIKKGCIFAARLREKQC